MVFTRMRYPHQILTALRYKNNGFLCHIRSCASNGLSVCFRWASYTNSIGSTHEQLKATRFGLVWSGVAWCGLVWPGVAWGGLVWSGVAWRGLAWPGVAWCGLVWPGVARCGPVWPGVAWRCLQTTESFSCDGEGLPSACRAGDLRKPLFL